MIRSSFARGGNLAAHLRILSISNTNFQKSEIYESKTYQKPWMQSLTRERDGFKNFCREKNRGPRIQASQTLAIVPLPPNVVVLSREFSSSAPTQTSFFDFSETEQWEFEWYVSLFKAFFHITCHLYFLTLFQESSTSHVFISTFPLPFMTTTVPGLWYWISCFWAHCAQKPVLVCYWNRKTTGGSWNSHWLHK